MTPHLPIRRNGLRTFVTTLAVGCAALTPLAAEARITFDFDYSLDTSNFFSTSTANGLAARAALAAAADTFSDRLLDQLTAITPSGSNAWTPTFRNPNTGASNVAAPFSSVGANTLKVYTAGRLEGGPLAVGGYGGFSGGSGTQAWLDTIRSRGQAGALANPQTDFGRWGGSVSFDTSFNWNFSVGSGPAFSQFDFYSVALHELAHLLGFGTAPSFTQTLTSGLNFNGPKSMALNNGLPVPLANSGHLSSSLSSPLYVGGPGQQPSMSPSITNGQRKLITLIDWAGLDDLGWDLARPGDANADAIVDFDDLLILAQHYGAGSGRTWSEADFNYDNAVDFSDLLSLAQSYGLSGPLLTSDDLIALGGEGFAADWALAQSLVPEPAGLLSIGVMTLVARRRRDIYKYKSSVGAATRFQR